MRLFFLRALIGGDLFELYQCFLMYAVGGQKKLSLEAADCAISRENPHDPEQGIAAGERLVDTSVRK